MPTFSQEEIQEFASEIKKQLLPVLLQELREKQLPPVLTRKQFMELVDIGPSKCNELFNRQDFPVNRELGHPKVITKDFFEWLSATNQNADEVNFSKTLKII
ncbi:hypothetical protein [Virgibacillus doumboii]|uniref:hypothetical protein n=1 Tax=Virgibacillus doumboii TaxID=2697503 RepID=UPI0013DFB86A|nr:hypothetical protein [Virgibacillus doumboii]